MIVRGLIDFMQVKFQRIAVWFLELSGAWSLGLESQAGVGSGVTSSNPKLQLQRSSKNQTAIL